MDIIVTFTDEEIDAVKYIVEEKLTNKRKFVMNRKQQNVDGAVPRIDDDVLWMTHIMCLLTTQQRSGPGAAVDVFLQQDPFPLSLGACRKASDLQKMSFDILTDAQGIRRTKKISKAIFRNFQALESGDWVELRSLSHKLLGQRSQPPTSSHRALEEYAANFMDKFLEFGPKQSRNFWQSLGLTRYVFVLDSRIVKWLRENLKIETGLLISEGLGNIKYYQFVSDILLDLCIHAGILPCMFDAAAFDTFDEDKEWGNMDSIW
ncbi:MAG: hypothetical protein Q9P44_01955 [Anaerolineae bacterium]|nr:hypothetical protein [Anaerolineae bacterium]